MYCPVCFNSTLLPASNGVIKVTFNGKSKATSQLFYNTAEESAEDIYEKVRLVAQDYFCWYSEFQNQDTITNVSFYSADFVCKNKCKLTNQHRLNMVGTFLDPKLIYEIINTEGKKFNIKIDLNLEKLTE